MNKPENYLAQKIADLAHSRQVLQDCKTELAELEARIADEFGALRAVLRHSLSVAQADMHNDEQAVREEALFLFGQNGDRKPHPAAQIKMYKVLSYDPKQARAYCREHLPKALKLDRRAFERAAKVIEPDFVTLRREPRATIARDLSDYLPEPEIEPDADIPF